MMFYPIWSDSLGAKSFSIYLEACGYSIIIDPGVAVMQRSYPGGRDLHLRWYEEAYNLVKDYLNKSKIVIITHYHHDHYLWREEDIPLYSGKRLMIKDPNKYINDSQWERARKFLTLYFSKVLNMDIESFLIPPMESEFIDFVERYTIALSKDFGEYNDRRLELIEKGKIWFRERVKKWISEMWIKESLSTLISYIDGKSFKVDDLTIKFTEPLYHGIEYSRTGWVIGVVVDCLGRKAMFSSDIQGPTIEDYAELIIKESPEILFLDGPPTYLIPYMFNLINFKRSIDNIKRIIRETESLKLIVYDHHVTRDIKHRERLKEVYEYAKDYNIELVDVATYLGMEPAYKRVLNL